MVQQAEAVRLRGPKTPAAKEFLARRHGSEGARQAPGHVDQLDLSRLSPVPHPDGFGDDEGHMFVGTSQLFATDVFDSGSSGGGLVSADPGAGDGGGGVRSSDALGRKRTSEPGSVERDPWTQEHKAGVPGRACGLCTNEKDSQGDRKQRKQNVESPPHCVEAVSLPLVNLQRASPASALTNKNFLRLSSHEQNLFAPQRHT